MQARQLGTLFPCLRQQKQRLSVWRRVRSKALGRHTGPHCSYLNVWFSVDILYAFMKLCLYPGLSSTREPSGSRKVPITGQSLWRVSTVILAQPEMTASGKNHTEGSLNRLKIKIWISWGSLAILQELKTLADFQSNRLKPLHGHLPVLAAASGTSGSRTPQQQKVCVKLF